MSNLNIQRVTALPGSPAPSTLYIVKSASAPHAELYFTNVDGTETRHVINKAEIQAMIDSSIPEGAASADKLTNARHITATGDASWDVLFDGSADASAVLTLSSTGVTAGEHQVVTVDAKGRVTAGRALIASDIPNLPGSKITSDITVNTSGNAATATKLATPRAINGVNFDGSADITINAVDSTARIAASEKGANNGVATLDGTGKVPSSQLPSFVDDVVEVANFAALPGTGESSKIYITIDTGMIYRWGGSAYVMIPGGVGLADAALKLNTARNITITGDGTWTVSFDGSANVTAALTLANTGISAGEYAVATYDAKGRATAGRALQASDIPTLDSTTVSSAASIALAVSEW